MNSFRDNLRKITPYVPGEQSKEKDIVKINANENPYPPSPKAVEALKKDIGDEDATTGKMFGYAMQMVNANKDCRVPDFNGHYALSRAIFTTIIIAVIIAEIKYCCIWYSWPLSIGLLLLAWNRFRERGYYYAREVLNEYLKMKNNK